MLMTFTDFRDDALATYKELFLSACPKYLSVNPPPYEDHQLLEAFVESPPQDATARHVELFLADVVAVKEVQSVRNLLRLYTSIDAGKLSAFVGDQAGEEEVLQQLMALKAASRNYEQPAGSSLLEGIRASSNNLDFTIDGVSSLLGAC
jgi:translation initiation factor 3 subunit L